MFNTPSIPNCYPNTSLCYTYPKEKKSAEHRQSHWGEHSLQGSQRSPRRTFTLVIFCFIIRVPSTTTEIPPENILHRLFHVWRRTIKTLISTLLCSIVTDHFVKFYRHFTWGPGQLLFFLPGENKWTQTQCKMQCARGLFAVYNFRTELEGRLTENNPDVYPQIVVIGHQIPTHIYSGFRRHIRHGRFSRSEITPR